MPGKKFNVIASAFHPLNTWRNPSLSSQALVVSISPPFGKSPILFYFLIYILSGVQRETDGIEKTDGQRLRIILYNYIIITHTHNTIVSIKIFIPFILIFNNYASWQAIIFWKMCMWMRKGFGGKRIMFLLPMWKEEKVFKVIILLICIQLFIKFINIINFPCFQRKHYKRLQFALSHV